MTTTTRIAPDTAGSDDTTVIGEPIPAAVATTDRSDGGQPLAVEPEDRPRPINQRTIDDRASLWGSLGAAVAVVWVAYEHVLNFSGTVGFVLCSWLVFLAFYTAVSLLSQPWPIVKDRLAAVVVAGGALLVTFALATTLVTTFWNGVPALRHLNFYVKDMAGVSPGTDPLTRGGAYHAILGTGIEVLIGTLISLPLGIGTAVFLSEVRGTGTRLVRTVVEAMTALPDILAGLFVYVLLIILLGWQRSGFAAAVALSITMTPIVARSAEVVLRVVPAGLREASLALGASRWQTVWRVVLPTARAGLATSLILGIARVAGETAPLLIVSGATTFTNHDPFHRPMNSLPLLVYAGARSDQPLYVSRAYGAASLLLFLVLVLFIITRLVSRNRLNRRR